MKKPTAVEWLIAELQKENLIKLDNATKFLLHLNFATLYEAIIYKAKELEKEQIINAYVDVGNNDHPNLHLLKLVAEEYYNKTYGGDE